ncbi:hypothetical protein KI387_010738, partial [Taxus chinensis]
MAGKFRRKPRRRRTKGGRKASQKPRGRANQWDMEEKKRRKQRFIEGSDSSDEDFVLDEEEEEDDDIESTSGEEVVESDDEEEAESTESENSEEDSNLPKPRRNLKTRQKGKKSKSNGKAQALKKNPRNQSILRVKISSSDDDEDFDPDFRATTEDDDYADDDNEGEEIPKSQMRQRTTTKLGNSDINKSRKRKNRTPATKKLVKKEKKSKPATKRRRTTAVSQKVIRSTACSGSESDDDFVPVQRSRAKHQGRSSQSAETGWVCPRRGKVNNSSRKFNSSSDSDFVCSESDADYTISEAGEPSYWPHGYTKPANRPVRALSIEKQETVSYSRDWQEKKRKSISDSDISRNEEGLRKKGKIKVYESKNVMYSDLAKPVCGICLSDEGKAIRGKLDCCDHFFCFACIMEWAKVESRCPMCKQRFNIISKSLKSGKGLRGTAIKIPVRDQVYQPSEEEVLGFLDPYSDIVCLECHEAGDDGLLLLCDLCDSAYHTYCVGLGRAVPEGDWYCQLCQTSRPAQNNTEEEEVDDFVLDLHNEDDGLTIRELVEGSAVDRGAERINFDLNLSPPSSSAFVRDTPPNHVRTIRRRIFRRSIPNPSPGLSDPARAPVRQAQLFGSTSQVSSAGARTLSGQRRLQERIHVLHDNWSALERASQQSLSGPLADSNYVVDDGADATRRPTFNNRSCLSRESARTGDLESPAGLENGLHKSDIDQAWSMMEESRVLVGGNVHMDNSLRGGRNWQGSSSAHSKNDISDVMGIARPRVELGTSSPAVARSRTCSSQGRLHPETVNCREHSGRIIYERSHREIGNNVLPVPNVSNRVLCPNLSERSDSPGTCLNNPVLCHPKPHENDLRKVEGAKDQVRTMVKAHMMQLIAGKEVGDTSRSFMKFSNFKTITCKLYGQEKSIIDYPCM